MDYIKAKEFIVHKLEKELPKYLTYHSLQHVMDVLHSVDDIASNEEVIGEDLVLLHTAALYHDCGFTVQAKDHEEIGCQIAQKVLPGFNYSPHQIQKICGMIMATKIPQTPHNLLEQIIADADLDYLGRDDFYDIGATLFLELKHSNIVQTESQWNEIQIKFLQQHNYFTQTSLKNRNPKKQQYLAELITKIS